MTAWAEHGGRTDLAQARYPEAPQPWLDLSTGINPEPWCAREQLSVDLGPLPLSSQLAELERAALGYFGGESSDICALPGTEIGLRLLRFFDVPRPCRYVIPSYGTHRGALAYASPICVDDLEDQAEQGGTILIANPNNPDGRALAPERLIAVARTLAAQGGMLIVDEAFADAVPQTSIVPHLSRKDRVLVFRSFGKFFGLAGMRLGFVLAPQDVISWFRDALGSWPVSTQALVIGTAAYRDRDWTEQTRRALGEKAATLDALLGRHGLAASGECPLFRLIESDNAAAIFERLARRGILTRPFDYAPTWLRFGLPADAAAFERLDRALAGG